MSIDTNLSIILRQRNITAYQLAKDIGVSGSTISRIKAGVLSPRLDTLLAISQYLGITVSQLIGEVELPAPIYYADEGVKERLEVIHHELEDILARYHSIEGEI